jgi:periplasmic divalent cation tolerance protein
MPGAAVGRTRIGLTDSHSIVEISTTVPTQDVAEHIAAELVEGNWAACVQISGPVQSVYRWDGAVQRAQEYVLRLKTSERCLETALEALRVRHPYSVPEILWHPVNASQDYSQWISGICSP